MKLSYCRVGCALGLTWGVCMLFLGLVAMGGRGGQVVSMFGDMYIGFDATLVGSLLGLLWGFVDGFICGVVFVFFWNLVGGCGGCCKGKESV